MRKITLLFFVFTFFINQAQNTSTPLITLPSGDTVQFEVNGTTNLVTMTMTLPENDWLAIGLDASGMGSSNKDVIVYDSSGIQDRYLDGYATPPLDSTQDWAISSNTVSNSVRTVIATRTLNTGDNKDYVFTTSEVSFLPMIWAKGSGTLGSHGSNKGVTSTSLGTPDILIASDFKVHPNPTINELNFEFPQNIQSANVQVYNVLGKQILQKTLKKTHPKLNTSSWASGMYVVQIVTDNAVQTKRVVKQ